ncbi:EAL domain-containing protein [Paenibacillus doosanensis]|uniref:EAL-domain containing protein YkuI n=1 Tax=Paenibacillus konkukensis TaxID=2020716 RepID=A0ABY4RQN6_9BACL|nr:MULTISPECIES: EAL domain-containing protein [Paenibacillus]MCS7459517.1 EAL domain-containing protein [Paenibacillus doosanensis]UQZ84826.1 putative EAL-domain containing protein YkuI [Paenibacillus konkukensis]
MLSGYRMPQDEQLVPYFQPILSLQTQKITAYEALGRMVDEGGVRSLGPFFQNDVITDEQHLHVDRILREKAIARMARAGSGAMLFLNLKPSWIYRMYKATGELPTLQFIEKHGLDPSRVVIEVTEEEFHGRLDELSSVVDVYRRHGCLVAIDDIGSGYSNYDRIASIQPNILKIDLKLLKKSAMHDGYKALLNSFSILSSQMGSSLLIEGVETKRDLYHSLRAGARYVQGFLFSEAGPCLQQEDAYESLLKEELRRYTEQEIARYRELFSVQNGLSGLVRPDAQIASAEEADAMIESLLPGIELNVVRIYICRDDGCQVSSNYVRDAIGEWEKDARYRGSNWIWRPYFIPNMLRMSHQRQGMLSQEYTDLDTSRPMQTYSCPIGDTHYLFLDLQA